MDYLFISMLEELKVIKKELDDCVENITFRHLHKDGLSFYINKNNKINELLLKYSNHIAPENINYILRLFICKKWTSNFSQEELEKIFFLTRFFKPISIWDSEHNKKEIQYDDSNKFEEVYDQFENNIGVLPKKDVDKFLLESVLNFINKIKGKI